MTTRRRFLAGLAGLAVPAGLARTGGAGPVTRDEIGDAIQTVPRGQLPDFAETPELRQLYRYALEHEGELRYIPCTCGCASYGHRDNRHCCVKAGHPDGRVTFTSHAAT